MRKTLVNVLVDNIGFIQNQVALYQDGHATVGVHDRDILGLVEQVNITNLKVHAFFVQDETAALRKWTRGSRIKHHHGVQSPAKNQKKKRAVPIIQQALTLSTV